MSTQVQTRKIYYVLSTHWDREWYQSFQDYRHRLVQLMDRVLDGIENGVLKGPFQTDGQAIILEDYLEVRPERRAQVERFAREGLLAIGPWYVLPDEFLISGESHIRNIRLGRQIARNFGTSPSDAGFICDLFGHISQMPQIFAGFGIKGAFLWRGVNLDDKRHLVWTGADGSELVCYKFANIGYCDYAFKVRDADKHGVDFTPADKEEKLEKYLRFEASETEIDSVLIFDGGDHQEWDRETYSVLSPRLGQSDDLFSYQHTSLDEYIEDMLAQKDRIATRLSGELREPGRTCGKASHQIHGVLSSRVWIKQLNQHCQNLLTLEVEPLRAFANRALSMEYPQGYLNVAWQHLIRNHPHDSICGCSIDAVHEDMKYRFAQCSQIGERLVIEATQRLAASIEGDVAAKEVRVAVFNPLAEAFDEVAELTLEIPSDFPAWGEFFNFEAKPAFRLEDSDGNEIPFQRLGQRKDRGRMRIWDAKFPEHYRVNEVRVSLPLKIAGLGYTSFKIKPGVQNEPIRYPQDSGLANGARGMENEFLAVRIESNGTLTVTDKRNGEVYADFLTFEDRADIGDGWFHGVAVNDQIQVSTAAQADIALIENGPNTAAFRVRTTMRVPEKFEFPTMTRSERRVEMHIDSVIRLRKGQDFLEVQTTIDNNADDHRVRVMFATNASTDKYVTDTPFDVVERTTAIRPDNHEYSELEVETKPQQSFCAIHDGRRGLAVIATGLMEACVRDLEDRPLALTLFRGTGRTVGTDGEPQGQLRGRMEFRYMVKPLSASPHYTQLTRLGQRLATGLKTVHVQPTDQKLRKDPKQTVPPRGGFLEVHGDAILTSARMEGSALEVRLFNPTSAAIESKLVLGSLAGKFNSVTEVDLESNPVKTSNAKLDGNVVSLKLAAKKILTISLA